MCGRALRGRDQRWEVPRLPDRSACLIAMAGSMQAYGKRRIVKMGVAWLSKE